MTRILILSSASDGGALPALDLLPHESRRLPASTASLANAPDADVIVVDARADLAGAKALCGLLGTAGIESPILLVATEGGLAAVGPEWGIADVVLDAAGPAEVDARIRLVLGRGAPNEDEHAGRVQTSGLTIDESSYSAKAHGKPLDLTFKEFQLLHFFASHPSRVFTREQLLSEVWGYDYFGGTRTVDVHVRRLRAKLGDLEQLIGTVRNVGYRFVVEDASDS
ncbi:winged helix-turn-helix transcriptional regulator [Microbacterium halophytorum]|uniref:winged helix-turn-helix transcriptional regulator n=1 Tax=Microbacterium halophytorum TaxID=2067568 RepID=UPI000CFB9BBD|nr:response regulator transcription factor [Microbacterium halophytorum]